PRLLGAPSPGTAHPAARVSLSRPLSLDVPRVSRNRGGPRRRSFVATSRERDRIVRRSFRKSVAVHLRRAVLRHADAPASARLAPAHEPARDGVFLRGRDRISQPSRAALRACAKCWKNAGPALGTVLRTGATPLISQENPHLTGV